MLWSELHFWGRTHFLLIWIVEKNSVSCGCRSEINFSLGPSAEHCSQVLEAAFVPDSLLPCPIFNASVRIGGVPLPLLVKVHIIRLIRPSKVSASP